MAAVVDRACLRAAVGSDGCGLSRLGQARSRTHLEENINGQTEWEDMNIDEYAAIWERNKTWSHLSWPKHQRRFDLCAERLVGRNFADVGCAFGHSTMELHRRTGPDSTWTGIDFTPKMIGKARKFFPEGAWLLWEDFRKPLGGEFDSIVCSEVIEHIGDGLLHVFVGNVLKLTKFRAVFTTPNCQVSDPGHLRVFTKDMLEGLFPQKGRHILSDGVFWIVWLDLT